MSEVLRARLLANGQSHLVEHFDGLDAAGGEMFRKELESVDWERASSMHRLAGPHRTPALPAGLKPVPSREPSPEEHGIFWNHGLDILSRGKAAFVLMAGGQGSRLGFEGPKGACLLGLPDDLVLFEILVRRLLRLGRLCGRTPPFAIMTGPENDEATREWFRTRKGLPIPANWPVFFLQSAAPALDDEGRALLAQPGRLALVPDGNGGIWERLSASGLLAAWKTAGVEWLHVAGVDNLLSLPCDPVFLGFAAQSGQKLSCKSVLRTDPSEKVGVYVLDERDRPRVAEYTELPPETASARATDGLPVFREANIASHLVSLDLAETYAALELPWHLARKKIPHVDARTGEDRSDEPGCKYERFLFDAFPASGGMSVLRVRREAEFAAVKNAQGPDSPRSAREALDALHASWRIRWGRPVLPAWVDPLESYAGEAPDKTEPRS